MARTTERVTYSLPVDVIRDINEASRRVGITRSALVAESLRTPLADFLRLLDQVPENPDAVAVHRLIGEGAEVVRDRLASVERMRDDLFSDKGR